jgi:hypothetical protein
MSPARAGMRVRAVVIAHLGCMAQPRLSNPACAETGERAWSPADGGARVSGLMPRATSFLKPISLVFAARIHTR